jgi:hypothetical protein
MKRTGNLSFVLTIVALVSGLAIAGDDQVTRPELDAKAKRERLLTVYQGEAAGYTIYRDAGRTEKVELRNDPIYVWSNPVRFGQDGAVFVWTCRGRAEVVGTIFSSPVIGPRIVTHEFHSLATTVLDVTHEGEPEEHQWKPSAPGITLAPVAGAPAVAPSPARRLTQMRSLMNEFTARSEDKQGGQWELRLLPQPLYRYQSTDPEVLDGAVFSFVTSAGTDPEILLVIEARRNPEGDSHSWQFALARFSDLNLWVRHKGNEVFKAISIRNNLAQQDPQDRYRCFRNRKIPAIEDLTP